MLVKTNEEYYAKFGRTMWGTLVHVNDPADPVVGVILCNHQEGKIIPEYTNSNVLMLIRDLEVVPEN